MRRRFFVIMSVCCLALAASSCNTDDTDPYKKTDPTDPVTPVVVTHAENYEAKCYLRDVYMTINSSYESKNRVLTGYYYWASQIGSTANSLDLDKYDIYDCFDNMLYTSTDRWSWMEDAASYLQEASGEYKGTWGVSFIQAVDDYKDYTLHVRYLWPSSPLTKFGVTRGAKLLKLGELDISGGFKSQTEIDYYDEHLYDSPQTFSFRLADGRDTTFTTDLPYSLSFNYIHASKVFTDADFEGLTEPVGYLNYAQFEANFTSALDTAFANFKQAGVKKLILDLRYNGGGSSVASDLLISYIAPQGLAGQPYVTRTHNSHLAAYNTTDYIGKEENNGSYSDISIGLEDIYFIMSANSASASEMVYNGLRPYMQEGVNLHLVGKQSYGKPNGMYVLYYPGDDAAYERYNKDDYSKLEWVFYPICFYNQNAAGQNIPAGSEGGTGFTPEKEYPDDIYHDFCPAEERIGACLTHIVTGSFPEAGWSQSQATEETKSFRGLVNKALLPESETNPNYGRYIVEMPEMLK